MFDGAAYCPHCGAPRQRVVAEGEAGACPGCGGTLRQVTIGSTALLECDACDGVWMDADAFERLCADREAQAAVLHRERPARPPARAAIHYRPCLRCGKLMNRINFGKASGVIVDTCRGHGTFLDAGELHRIAAFIQGGGLDRMREREREALVEEQRRLEALQQHQPGSLGGGETDVFRWSGPSLEQLLGALRRRL